MSPVGPRLLVAIAVGGLVFGLTYYWRDFPLRLAILSGLSVAVLGYSTVQASERLRHLFRRR